MYAHPLLPKYNTTLKDGIKPNNFHRKYYVFMSLSSISILTL